MPSSTFLNLPAQKQEKLLEAATREFSQRPYNEASINQIIKDAGIPRGSFYMYFTDKEELFRYVLSGYVDQMVMVLEEALLREHGDIFAALLRMYDYTCAKREEQGLGGMGAMTAILSCNSGIHKNTILAMVDTGQVLRRLKEQVNPDVLDLRREGDLGDMLNPADGNGTAAVCRHTGRRRSRYPGAPEEHAGDPAPGNGSGQRAIL